MEGVMRLERMGPSCGRKTGDHIQVIQDEPEPVLPFLTSIIEMHQSRNYHLLLSIQTCSKFLAILFIVEDKKTSELVIWKLKQVNQYW
jgi:hypothetical protein